MSPLNSPVRVASLTLTNWPLTALYPQSPPMTPHEVKHIHLELPTINVKDTGTSSRAYSECDKKKQELEKQPATPAFAFSRSNPFSFLPASLSLSVCLATMQQINSAACLVISSLGQTENERWGWVPPTIYAPDCYKSQPQQSHLHAGDLMNYRGLFMPLKARWVTTL